MLFFVHNTQQVVLKVNTSLHLLEPVCTAQKTAPRNRATVELLSLLWSVSALMATTSCQEGTIKMNLVVRLIDLLSSYT